MIVTIKRRDKDGKLIEERTVNIEELDPVKAKGFVAQMTSGLQQLVYSDKAVEALAKERLKICADCPAYEKYSGVSVCSIFVEIEHNGKKAFGCGCSLDIKTRSAESSCPVEKWKGVNLTQYKNAYYKEK